MSQSKVLIVGDDAEFAQTVMARWQAERMVPELATLDSANSDAQVWAYDLIILGAVNDTEAVLKACEAATRPVIAVAGGANQAVLREPRPRVLVMREHEGWADTLVLLASEVLRRIDATARMRKTDQALAASEGHATLGRFMVEMLHSFNNALTSILGNSELLLLDPGALSVETRDQVETIHTMALRIHDIVQRFSSMESELQLSKNGSQHETGIHRAMSYAAMASRLTS